MTDQQPTVTTSQNDVLGTGAVWEQIRDFVCRNIEERWGARIRHQAKDDAIFRSFVERFGPDDAWYIARAAVLTHQMVWKMAPLHVERFSQSNDEFFSRPILTLKPPT